MPIPWGSKWDIEIIQGAGFEQPFELYESLSDGQPDLTAPINFLDGTTARAQCRRKERLTGDLITEFTVDIQDNKLTLKLSGEQTEEIIVSSGYYDVFVTEPEAEPQMFIEGQVSINQSVTTEPGP